jgi:haloalkane dehalogenase
MDVLRTPDERFARLPEYGFPPRYVTVDDLRIHYVEAGPPGGAPVLMLHGEPSWSFLYRQVIAPVAAAGYRVIAPDLVGFGRSDKPARREDHTYARHVGWMAGLLAALDLRRVTLVCQDWGGLIGLRLVAEHAKRFDRVLAANTGLPTGDQPPSAAFMAWQQFAKSAPSLRASDVIAMGSARRPAPEVLAAYDAPFPDESYLAGVRQLPLLVPTTPDDPAAEANRRAWAALQAWEKPFLTAFSDGDPITAGADRLFQQLVPGARGQPHVTIRGAGHFLQEDSGAELARVVLRFLGGEPASEGVHA